MPESVVPKSVVPKSVVPVPAPPSAEAIVIGHDLPEPTSYRGQHIIPLDIPSDAWLSFAGLSYWVAPYTFGSVGTCAIAIGADEGFDVTCAVYTEAGEQLSLWDSLPDVSMGAGWHFFGITLRDLPEDSPGDGQGPWRELVHGSSLTFRFNYRGSENVRDVVVPLDFGGPLITALDRRKLCFRLTNQPVTSTRLAAQDRRRPEPKSPLIYLHGYEDPDTGYETPGTRVPPIALTRERIAAAWKNAKATGYFDPAVFPNVAPGDDEAGRTGALAAVSSLDEATVVAQLTAGGRLAVHRAATGEYTYRFLPAPAHCAPGLVLVEYYQLSSFPARYGSGRTIKTFSLLPGEKTSIRVSTYKRSAESLQKTSSILDSTNTETESEFARTVNSEQSNQDNASKSFEYRAEAEAEGKATWGWGSASAKISGGVSGSSNSAREEFTKNLTNAVNQNTARASSRREVQVDTSLDVKLEQGEEQAVDRTLENINVSRTLNFVFRQMNQEFVTLLHLVDVRVAFFNGHAESRDEVPLAELDRLLGDCLLPDRVDEVGHAIWEELRAITDYRGQEQPGFIREEPAGRTRVNPGFTSSYTGPDGRKHTVPGIILAADQHVLRTDGVVVDSFLGEGSALDDYSAGLQVQAVRGREAENQARQVDTQLRRLEAEKLKLALSIVSDNDAERAALFQRLFVRPQIVNQIDHAAVNGQAVGTPQFDGQTTDGQMNGGPLTDDPAFPSL
ncbi:hypothetical protein [Planotetraspora sp. GP83]|uniref:hypothetical protein n=1 Tax=Planotetraspora sp. GP83 TaxID=3156264 RepID=UPI0035149CCB